MFLGIFIGALFGMGIALMILWVLAMKDGDEITALISGSFGMAGISMATILLLASLDAL